MGGIGKAHGGRGLTVVCSLLGSSLYQVEGHVMSDGQTRWISSGTAATGADDINDTLSMYVLCIFVPTDLYTVPGYLSRYVPPYQLETSGLSNVGRAAVRLSACIDLFGGIKDPLVLLSSRGGLS